MASTYFVKRSVCPACKSSNHKRIYSCRFTEPPIREYLQAFYRPVGRIEFEYFNNSKFVLNECSDCGLIWQGEIPNDFLMKKLYEEWIHPDKSFERSQNYTLDDYMYYAQEIIPIISYFNTLPGQLKFLDFGMGWGQWCQIVKALGVKSYGTELSEARVKHAEAIGIKTVTWDDLPKHNYHFINTEQVFEHLADPLETLIYLEKALRPDGLLKIHVPNGKDIKRRLKVGDWKAPKDSKNSLNPVSPLEHINCFTNNTIIRMADITGFEPYKFPLGLQYSYAFQGRSLERVLKNVLRPLYRNLFKKANYVFLKKKKT